MTEQPVAVDRDGSRRGWPRRRWSQQSWWERSWAAKLSVIMVGAVLLRLAYVVVVTKAQPLVGDAGFYSAQGLAIAEGRGFAHPYYFAQTMPAADHPPLASIVMSLGPLVVGAERMLFGLPLYVFVQRLTLVLIGTTTVGVIGLLGRRLAGDRVGIVAAVVAALSPSLWINDGILMAESIAALMLACTLWAAIAAWNDPSWQRWAVLGGAVGLSALARSESVLLMAVMVLPMLVMAHSREWWRLIEGGAAAGLMCAVVASTWVLPNLARFDERALFSTNDGLTWLGANCPETFAGDGIGLWSLNCLSTVDTDNNGSDDLADLEAWSPFTRVTEDQSKVSTRYQTAAFDFVGDNISELPKVVSVRVLRTWGLYRPAQMVQRDLGEGRPQWASWLAWGTSLLMLPVAAVGFVSLRLRRLPTWPFIAQAVLVTFVSALIYGLARFRLGWDVAACVLVAVALDAALRRWWTQPLVEANVEAASPIDVCL